MSLFNMVLGGSGSGASEFKKAKPSSINAKTISFSIANEPEEYILMLVPSGYSGNTSTTIKIVALIANTLHYKNLGSYMPNSTSKSMYYCESLEGNVSTEFSSGTFTIYLLKTQHRFNSDTVFNLFYR